MKQALLNCNFEEAEKIYYSKKSVEIRDIILEICYETESIIPYSFITYLIYKQPNAALHYLASEILSMPLCHICGAYNLALYHTKCAIKLAPDDITLKENLLLFYNIPEKLIDKQQAFKIAKEIVEKKPDSKVA